MTTDKQLLPCPWCNGETQRFHLSTADGEPVEMVTHIGWPHCCVRRASMTLAQWNTRMEAARTSLGEEVVERVARAMSVAEGRDPDRVSPFIKVPKGLAPDLRHDRLWKNYETAARAAILAMQSSGPDTERAAPKDGPVIRHDEAGG